MGGQCEPWFLLQFLLIVHLLLLVHAASVSGTVVPCGPPNRMLLSDHEIWKSMSPLIGQVPVNNAGEMLSVGVGSRRKTKWGKKRQNAWIQSSQREGNRGKSNHSTQLSPHNTGGRFDLRSTLPTWSRRWTFLVIWDQDYLSSGIAGAIASIYSLLDAHWVERTILHQLLNPWIQVSDLLHKPSHHTFSQKFFYLKHH